MTTTTTTKKTVAALAIAAWVLPGCATRPDNVVASSVSSSRYADRTCKSLVRELDEVQDALRVQVRTTAEELRQAADVIAERLNAARGPWTFLVPLQGWSSLDRAGRPIHDPAADAAFVARLKAQLHDPSHVKEVDLHLYTPEFARVAVDEFVRLFQAHKSHC